MFLSFEIACPKWKGGKSVWRQRQQRSTPAHPPPAWWDQLGNRADDAKLSDDKIINQSIASFVNFPLFSNFLCTMLKSKSKLCWIPKTRSQITLQSLSFQWNSSPHPSDGVQAVPGSRQSNWKLIRRSWVFRPAPWRTLYTMYNFLYKSTTFENIHKAQLYHGKGSVIKEIWT